MSASNLSMKDLSKISDSIQEELQLLRDQNHKLASKNEELSARLNSQIEENQRLSLKIAQLENLPQLPVP